ncbi:PilZ domain-containing protein [Marinobacterium arenosum]|uniref:PilZ domain-containing protein n=1 Tax=Marinobacterium arenosum TaxID=2862496 RepID=UPI001C9880F5|nr:PilZ domain-containing protein [Marinobacterium arenosum]MBY4675272.1 PilZ domain-containing protein [Marinobacterium arenosum]
MQDKDRRQFFRINQKVALDIRPIQESELLAGPRPEQFEVSPAFSLLCELHEQDAESHHLLRKIAERDGAVASYLQLLNNKIDALGRALVSSSINMDRMIHQHINLSEGGMLFQYPQPLDEDGYLAMKLIFPDSCLGILLHARVLRCKRLADEFEIAVEFYRLPENCRTQLARQIIESQAQTRRQISNG